jgi:site-specific DNA-methyltransferase (cytosine-N4-specific)
MKKPPIRKRIGWGKWVTPNLLREKPVHRWFVFPHSFTSELVHKLIAEWGLGASDHIVDPFVGAGTTLLAAKEKGIPATGYDLSPLAILASRVKTANFQVSRLENGKKLLARHLNRKNWKKIQTCYASLVERALGPLLGVFDLAKRAIQLLPISESEQDFFRLALLAVMPKFSRAVATGGWLKWVNRRPNPDNLPPLLFKRIGQMIDDLRQCQLPPHQGWKAEKADARFLPAAHGKFSAVITSPPYPNRHDYTRVFGVELMFGLLDWEENRQLRYQSFHSHPEARPIRPKENGYSPPLPLEHALRLVKSTIDPRIYALLSGYFLDMHHCLRELKRVCRKGARIGLVVGNTQYVGVPFLVDQITAEIGENVGLNCTGIFAARYRGNSAQQMGKYGRRPSRESVVVFSKK